MQASHFHLKIKDLPSALTWLDKVWGTRPSYQNPQMAVIPFGDMTFVLDADGEDSAATIAFATEDCDAAFTQIVARGAEVISTPEDLPWGVRAAYLQGPGKLTFEIEQRLP